MSGVLFFFEAGFFVLAIVALVLAEVWGRWPTLVLWGALTAASLAANPIVWARRWRGPPADASEERWRRLVRDNWRHLNLLLLLGLAALGGWWWLETVTAQP